MICFQLSGKKVTKENRWGRRVLKGVTIKNELSQEDTRALKESRTSWVLFVEINIGYRTFSRYFSVRI